LTFDERVVVHRVARGGVRRDGGLERRARAEGAWRKPGDRVAVPPDVRVHNLGFCKIGRGVRKKRFHEEGEDGVVRERGDRACRVGVDTSHGVPLTKSGYEPFEGSVHHTACRSQHVQQRDTFRAPFASRPIPLVQRFRGGIVFKAHRL